MLGNAPQRSSPVAASGAHDAAGAPPTEPQPKMSFVVAADWAHPVEQLELLHGGLAVLVPVAHTLHPVLDWRVVKN